MSSALTVADRRRATLDRLQADSRSRRGGAVREERAKRTVHGGGRTLPRLAPRSGVERSVPEVLGPRTMTYYSIVGVVAVFVMLGLVMVLSASAVTQANIGNSPYRVFGRQAAWAGVGLVGLLVAARLPYRLWRLFVVPLGVLGVLAMAAPFAPGIGASVNGARSWVRVGGLSVQPSEFLKLVLVIVAADLLTRRGADLAGKRSTIVSIGVLAAVGAGLSLAQGDLGSAVVLGAIVFSVAWIAGVPMVPLGLMATAAGSAGMLFVISSPRRIDRFTAFLNVSEEKDHLAYQTYQGFLSMANGGLSGSGIGGSKGKLGYLPYAHSDFIFAVIADELGFAGTIAVVGGFVLLVWLGIQTALAAPDRFGMLLAGGIASWFGVQAIVNLGGVTGLLPVTGLTLPFFSAGGSSLFVSMVAAGLLLSVARRINSPAVAEIKPAGRARPSKR